MPSSRGSSQPRDQILISCIGRGVLYHQRHPGSLTSQVDPKDLEGPCCACLMPFGCWITGPRVRVTGGEGRGWWAAAAAGEPERLGTR